MKQVVNVQELLVELSRDIDKLLQTLTDLEKVAPVFAESKRSALGTWATITEDIAEWYDHD